MEIKSKVKNYCISCFKDTNHTVERVLSIDGSYDYQVTNNYYIVKCDGCDHISFRREIIDYEVYDYDDDQDEYIPMTHVSYFPKSLKGRRQNLDLNYLPDKITAVYEDTIRAFTAGAYLLTGVGFRAIIEGVCSEQNINVSKSADGLKDQIDKMSTKNLITKREANRLHTIRFLGNDSVHAMIVPRYEDLVVVLDIVDHLLNNVYVLDNKIKGGLEKIITDIKGLQNLLDKSIKKFEPGTSLSLGGLLGTSSRRLGSSGNELEKQLIEQIESGNYTKLTKGDLKPHQDANKPDVQYYNIL